jgi:hypothetical protein
MTARCPACGQKMPSRGCSDRLARVPVGTVTPEELTAKATDKGQWTYETLTAWGVPVPPPAGWKARLTAVAAA